MKITLFFIFCCVLVLTKTLYAHGLSIRYNEGQVLVYFSASVPASGATITLVAENGVIIHQDKLDENGTWTIPEELTVTPKVIIVKAPGGHRITKDWNDLIKGSNTGFFHSMSTRIVLGIFILIGSSIIMKRFYRFKKGKHD